MLRFRDSKWCKGIALTLVLTMVSNFVFPTAAQALTSGPSQPEFSSFEPVETTQMVDPYTGDFTYNIPLFSVPGPNGGYPINMSYHSNVGMDEEASWVGLGWSLNIGAINRQLRGVPDDFSNNQISYESYIKDDYSFGINIPTAQYSRERYGIPTSDLSDPLTSFHPQIYYNNYRGVGYRVSYSAKQLDFVAGSVGIGLSFDSQSGDFGIEPNLKLGGKFSSSKLKIDNLGFGIGASVGISSMNGLESTNFSASLAFSSSDISVNKKKRMSRIGSVSGSLGSSFSFNYQPSVPSPQMPVSGKSGFFDIKFPIEALISNPLAVTISPYNTRSQRWLYYTGYYSSSKSTYDHSAYTKPAYGYLYTPTSAIASASGAITDRSNDPIPYSKHVPYLSSVSFDYDLFNMSGQGTGGMFRPYRSEIGILSTASLENITEINNINWEMGLGGAPQNTFHVGFDPQAHDGQNVEYTGAWSNGDDLSPYLNYNNDHTKFREPYYMQMYGEKSAVDLAESFLTTWGGDQAVRVKLQKTAPWATAQYHSGTEFIHEQDGSTIANASSGAMRQKTKRPRRASNVEQLTNGQAELYGWSKNVSYHNVPSDLPNNISIKTKFGSGSIFNAPAYKNEISEMSVVQPDGTRYIYGLPAMNLTQEQGSFRVKYDASSVVTSQSPPAFEHGVSLLKTSACLNAGSTDFTGNDGGSSLPLDAYFQRTKLPAYAHTWLLTTVVSSDYIDLTGDGPSDDDYGYWVKFNYKKQYEDYKWRVPYTDVSYNPGHIGDAKDNMGTYMYGTKQIDYIESVETKTHKAIFETSARKDAFEAWGALASAENLNTTRGIKSMHRLDKIKLYTKADIIANGVNAIPLQTVNFDYDYSLCPNVPNNNQAQEMVGSTDLNAAHGKLTLKHLWFTYQNNTRGRLSPYTFDYATSNPAYNPQAVDKWGNYRKTGLIPASENTNYPVIRFPYTLQNITAEPSTWLLSKITMPSGGKINVEYESDDYAYVQDKPAMQMFDITGVGDNPVVNCGRDNNMLQYAGLENKHIPPSPPYPFGDYYTHTFPDADNYRIYFKMEHIPTAADLLPYGGSAKQYVLDRYIHGQTKIYYNVEEHMLGNEFDEVAGYADIITDETVMTGADFYGVVYSGNNLTQNAYITLKKEPISQKNVFNDFIHPFQGGGFVHIRSERPELIFTGQSPTWSTANGFATANVASLLSFIPAIHKAAVGINRYLSTGDFCQYIRLNGRSIIRLTAPDTKVGGGVRVKKLYIEDTDFENIGDNSSYGQEFDYTMTENGKVISSGVAYEPEIGGDENALRQPEDYVDSKPLKSVLNLFTEKPILKNYYPGASVGYRKVIVRSLVHALITGGADAPDACHSVTPVISYEFYTPKDFPVITNETDISPEPTITRGYIIPGIYTKFRKSMAKSQGYSIVLNDMAGKLRKLTTYVPANPSVTGSTDRIISQEEYIYKTKNPYSPTQKNELDCQVNVMGNRGSCSQALIGETSDIFVTMDENKTESETDTWNYNIALSPTTIPYVVPIPLPVMSNSEMSMKTVVTTKVIYRTGILTQVRKFDGQAKIITDNLVFDAATGAPLMTSVNNEFGDHIFDFSLPAHWFYTGMSAASANQGFVLAGLNITPSAGGRVDLSPTTDAVVEDAFEPGDELWITPATGAAYKAYVLELITASTNNAIRIIKEDGSYISTATALNKIIIIRSGKRNQLTAPAGNIMTNVDPGLQNMCDLVGLGENGAVVHALKGVLNASAVQYSNNWNKACGSSCGTGNTVGNQINPFLSGMLGIWRPYKSYAFLDGRQQHDNIREDGIFNSFYLFNWDNPSASNAKWTLAGTITKYSPQGYEIENKDPLGIYSSALYGYGNSLVTAVANNARFTDMISDGFEDYPKACTESHWTLNSPVISSSFGHTGKRSLTVNANSSYSVGVPATTGTIADADNSGVVGFDALSTANFVSLNQYGCNGVFTPVDGREYFVSSWVKEVTTGLSYLPTTYANSQIRIESYTNSSMSTLLGSTVLTPSVSEQVIEGWQRISGKVMLPSGTGYIKVSFTSTSAATTAYFDDFRMLPSKGAMRAFVYDPLNFRHIADLDDNNFATYYVYDDEGKLIMKRVETSQGIRTVQESRTGTKH